MKQISGFTLIELVITTTILSILIGVLFQSYAYISTIAITLQTTSMIQKEILFVVQSIQNDVDHGSIQVDTSWWLQWTNHFAIQPGTGEIISYSQQCDQQNKCAIVRKQGGVVTILTNSENIDVPVFMIWILGESEAKGFRLRSRFTFSRNMNLGQDIQTFFTTR